MSAEEKRQTVRKSVLAAVRKVPRERPVNLAANSDSDDEPMKNRIGNVPLSWYNDEDHIGYDVYGKPIARKDRGDSIDAFLARTDDPNSGRTVYDALNDEKVVLTDEELSIINRLRKGKFPHRSFDPYEDWRPETEFHVGILTNPQEPKSRFVPSKHEAKMILKYVHSLRNGWIRDPTLPPEEKPKDTTYDLWGDGTPSNRHMMFLPPPKPRLPGHAESFNPPPEYLWTPKEREAQMALDAEDRQYNFTPKAFPSLRQIHKYSNLVKERYQRNLDLYLCVREKRKAKLNINPDSLLPKLPKPRDLRPFPTTFSLEFLGHTGAVRSIDVDPTGQWMVSGSEDKTVRVWEVSTARCMRVWNLEEKVIMVAWNPNPATPIVAAALESGVVLLNAGTSPSKEEAAEVDRILRQAPRIFRKAQKSALVAKLRAARARGSDKGATKAAKLAKVVNWLSWKRRGEFLASPQKFATAEYARDEEDEDEAEKEAAKDETGEGEEGGEAGRKRKGMDDGEDYDGDAEDQLNADDNIRGLAKCFLHLEAGASSIAWHGKGDYLCSVSPVSAATSVIVHRISRAASHLPFGKTKGLVQRACFHPTQPFFLVATQHHVKVYNLAEQKLVKTLQAATKWISSLAVHPGGDHVVIGGYDRRVCWFDMDLASTPYRTFKYHQRGVRSVAFHQRFPLLATASDDGCLHIVHATVYTDLITNPLIVPVKIINAHVPKDDVGVMQCVFHPHQPWIFSCSADKTIRMFS